MTQTLFAAIVLALSTLAAGTQQSPRDVAASLQRKYDGVRTFTTEFTQEHQGGVLRRRRVERGTLFVKKPGRMRWEYKSPEKKSFVSDGSRLYFHDTVANQVTVSEMPQADEAATAALFLMGRGDLTRDFKASFGTTDGSDTHSLRLDPIKPQVEYDWLEVVVDRQSLQIRSLTAADTQGGRSTFLFSNFRENVDLADKIFEFKIPRGAEVIHAGRPKR